MKKINYQPTVLFVLLIMLSGVLFSFSLKTAEAIYSNKNNFGGEGFTPAQRQARVDAVSSRWAVERGDRTCVWFELDLSHT